MDKNLYLYNTLKYRINIFYVNYAIIYKLNLSNIQFNL